MDNNYGLLNIKYLDIDKLLLNSYLRLRIDETDVVILLLLFEVNNHGSNFLSISELARKTTISIDDLANKVDILVTRGFVNLDIYINKAGEEETKFSVVPTVKKIFDLFKEDEIKEMKKGNTDIPRIVSMIEDEFKRVLSSKELYIIKSWEYSYEEVKEALLETLKQKKLRIEYLNKILENNNKNLERNIEYFNEFMSNE
ncbi:DnaD domain protein [Mycoplasmatota bacterium zrk1]